MLVTWTDQPAHFIEGVQGRYFTAPAFLLAYAIGARTTSEPRAFARLLPFGGFLLVSVSTTASTMLWRYYLGI